LSGVASALAATMVEVAKSNPQLTDFYNMVRLAGLGNALDEAPPFTAFVPVNAGYNKMPSKVRDALLTGKKGTSSSLQRIDSQTFMRNHAVRGVHPLSEFEGKVTTVQSVSGYIFRVDGTVPGKLTISEATDEKDLGEMLGALPTKPKAPINVILPPIETDNGIIYPIDGVLK
jgi:uncharacterized surface protein with fasciclin (FAS1) repeats